MHRKFAPLILVTFLLCACAGVTDLFYGPDLTPAQLDDAIFQDAYALGAIWVSSDPAAADDLVAGAKVVATSVDPGAAITGAWLDAVRDGDTENALKYYAARRLYDRLGAALVGSELNTAGVDPRRLSLALDAFIEGVGSGAAQ